MGRGEVGSFPGEGKSAAGLGRIQANDEIWGGEWAVASAWTFPCLGEHELGVQEPCEV